MNCCIMTQQQLKLKLIIMDFLQGMHISSSHQPSNVDFLLEFHWSTHRCYSRQRIVDASAYEQNLGQLAFFIFVVCGSFVHWLIQHPRNVSRRLSYCQGMTTATAVLAGLPTSTLAPLQRVLNAAARFVAGATSRTHVSGTMKSLHWLPIVYRIRFKLSVLMHGVHNGTNLSYLTHTTIPISSLPGHRQLRSAMTIEYDIPRTRIQFGDRACSVAGPREWTALPADIRNITDFSSFNRSIKTHSFVLAYSD